MSQYNKIVKRGIGKMKNSTVAICSTVRDCGKQLKRNIPVVEKLRKMFHDSCVIIVENDSVDNTKEVLSKWKAKSEKVYILGKDNKERTIPKNIEGGINPFYSCYRNGKMSGFRNQYLDFLENMNGQYVYVIIIDLDINKFDIKGIANSFGQRNTWDAISSNGKKFVYSKMRIVFHDTYALWEIGESNVQTEEIIDSNRDRWNFLEKGQPMIPVVSGFGGMAIYKFDSIKGCRYKVVRNNDKRVESYAEHYSLHQQMIANGHGKIFINPSQTTTYRTDLIAEILKRIKKK